MIHSISYDLDGEIKYKKQAGHLCNTGGEMKQVITGNGLMEKEASLYMEPNYIDVEDTASWNTSVDAINALTVTSTIELCIPAKHVYKDTDIPIDHRTLYSSILGNTYDQDIMTPLTRQIWAVQVSSNPAETGSLSIDFDAAHDDWDRRTLDEYRGSFFNMRQTASTSSGLLSRFIDISSALGHGYLHEDMSVDGSSTIRDSFRLRDRRAGEDFSIDWYELF